MNGLAGCYVSTIGKPHEYFDLTAIRALQGALKNLGHELGRNTIKRVSIIIIYPGLDSRPGLSLSTCWRAWSAREGRC